MARHKPNYQHTYYLTSLIRTDELKKTIKNMVAILKKHKFDAIAFRGMSGALMGPPLALAMDKTMIMVRKPGVKCHSGLRVEGDAGARTYVIVDDICDTGATAKAIVKEIKEFAPRAKCLGLLQADYLKKGLVTKEWMEPGA